MTREIVATIGIKPGEEKAGSAGGTRSRVSLSVSDDGSEATIGDRRIALVSGVLVVWHSGDAGTWRGFYRPADLRTKRAAEANELFASATDGRDVEGAALRGVYSMSSSGGGSIAAAVVRIPEDGIAVVTSGYLGRRDWRYRIYDATGALTWEGSPQDYRAMFANPEAI